MKNTTKITFLQMNFQEDAEACSCVDCELSCLTSAHFNDLSYHNYVFGDVPTDSFIAACVLFGIGCMTTAFIVFLRITRPQIFSPKENYKKKEKKIQNKISNCLETFFRKWTICTFSY